MDLKDFVSETLVQIQEDVQDAIVRRSSTAGAAGVINPVFGVNMDAAGADHLQKVEFDVAVTATEKASGGGKAGIKVFSIELGGEGAKSAEQSTVTRIKFTVPIIPPVQLVTPMKEGA